MKAFITLLVLFISFTAHSKENFICGIFLSGNQKPVQKLVLDLDGKDSYPIVSITQKHIFSIRKEFESVTFGFTDRERSSKTTINYNIIKKMTPSDEPISIRLYDISNGEEKDYQAECYNTKESDLAPFDL